MKKKTNARAEHESLSLMGQTIIVTGVSREGGIGAAIARKLAGAGATVAIHGYPTYDADLDYPDAKSDFTNVFAERLQSEDLSIGALAPSDLADPKAPARVVEEAVEKFGPCTGLVLNHAYSTHAPLGEWTAEHIDSHLLVNVRASMLMIQAFAAQWKQMGQSGAATPQKEGRQSGAVTLFTSGQYLGPMIDEMAYAVSKEAIRCVCEQTAAALGPENIRVNCVNPGPTDTGYLEGEPYEAVAGMFPSGRWGMPDDAANLVLFLHSRYAAWITGQTIASEGGFNRYR